MSAEMMIYVVAISIFSLAFIFIGMLIFPNKVTKEKIEKILGDDLEDIKNAKDDEELKHLIRNLSKRKRTKLKTLFESQDLQVAIKEIKKHILNKES